MKPSSFDADLKLCVSFTRIRQNVVWKRPAKAFTGPRSAL
jgi:hypothetical protein